MPEATYSRAIVLMSPITPCLAAAYAAVLGRGDLTMPEAMRMTRPYRCPSM
jgi:hypothetical protein